MTNFRILRNSRKFMYLHTNKQFGEEHEFQTAKEYFWKEGKLYFVTTSEWYRLQ